MPRAQNTPAHVSALSTALARNRLGTVDVGMAIASSIAPLTVTAALIPLMLGLTGLLAIPIAVLAVAGVFLLFSVGYLAMARHIPNAGAFYAYAARGIGRPVGVGVAWVALCTYLAFQIGTISLLAVLYFLVSWVLISAGGAQIIDRAGAEGTDLFFNQAATVLGQGALWGGRVLVLTSVLAAAVAFSNAVSRYAFALGREGVLARVFGRTSAAGAPRNASLAVSAVGLLVILVWAFAGWDPLVTLFFWGGTSGGLGVLLLITTTSVSVLCYFARHRHHESWWRTAAAPIWAASLLAVISAVAIDNLPALYGIDGRSGPAIVVPVGFLGILGAGIVWGLILKARRPDVYEGIGYGTHAATAGATGLAAMLGPDSTSPSTRTGVHR